MQWFPNDMSCGDVAEAAYLIFVCISISLYVGFFAWSMARCAWCLVVSVYDLVGLAVTPVRIDVRSNRLAPSHTNGVLRPPPPPKGFMYPHATVPCGAMGQVFIN